MADAAAHTRRGRHGRRRPRDRRTPLTSDGIDQRRRGHRRPGRRPGGRSRTARATCSSIACQGYSERALALIDGAVKQDPDRPVLVLAQGTPSGFVRRVFEAGADDILMLAADARAGAVLDPEDRRAQGREAARSSGANRVASICVLGPKGRLGQNARQREPRRRARRGGQRASRSSTSTCSSATSRSRLGLGPERTFYDLALAGGTLDAQKLDAYLMRHSTRRARPARPDPPRPGELDHGRIGPRRLRSAPRSTYEWSSSTRRPVSPRR